jgi:hypothetical protein
MHGDITSNNLTNTNKTNNHLSPKTIEHKNKGPVVTGSIRLLGSKSSPS